MEESKKEIHPGDINADGKLSTGEQKLYLEFKRRELEDQGAIRDARRSMTWFALAGMLLYPSMVVFTDYIDLDKAASILGDMAAVYFVSVAGIVAAFFGAQAWSEKDKKK